MSQHSGKSCPAGPVGWRCAGLGLLLLLALPAGGSEAPGHSAIASAHPLATKAGFDVLEAGGNAFDAAVAVASVLAVVEPFGSGLGGGGFFLLRRASDGKEVFVDAREAAPLAATAGMYLDPAGQPIAAKSTDGALSAAIPGLPAALAHLSGGYGRLGLRADLEPAMGYARSGIPVGARYRRAAEARKALLSASPEAGGIFLDHGGVPGKAFRLVQPDLADTLGRLAARGSEGFYGGETARKLVSGVRAAGGIWSLDDLRAYRIIEREPLRGEYRGMRLTTVPPPSGGGTVLLESLNVLAAYDLAALARPVREHLIIEALRRSYRDRDLYLGDPAFVSIPQQRLLSADYAAGLRVAIRADRALPSEFLSGTDRAQAQGDNTTHFSIMDREGNLVAATLSINYTFGSGFVPPGTGVLLNDEMDDFAVAPGKPNVYGLVGGEANRVAPGKRMLSSMTPSFLETDGRLAVLGTPGGSRISSMVLLAALDFAEGHGPASFVAVKRFHHQYLPDIVEYEPGALSGEEMGSLRSLGHKLKETPTAYGDMHGLMWDKAAGRVSAASDPRGEGAAYAR